MLVELAIKSAGVREQRAPTPRQSVDLGVAQDGAAAITPRPDATVRADSPSTAAAGLSKGDSAFLRREVLNGRGRAREDLFFAGRDTVPLDVWYIVPFPPSRTDPEAQQQGTYRRAINTTQTGTQQTRLAARKRALLS